MEARACGIPLVATDGGALPEVTGADGETVLLARAGDPMNLAKKILEGLDSAMLREVIAKNTFECVMSRFTWRETARMTEQNYLEVLAAHG